MVTDIPAALRYARNALEGVSDEAAVEAKYIVSHLSGVELNRLAISDRRVDTERIDEIVARRREGTPLQYIFGKWWFYSGEFFVGSGVLVPRQDTELLVETGLELIKDLKAPEVIDLCSGSGCVAISVAKERPDAAVTALEKYDAACAYLKKNILHNQTPNVLLRQADVTSEPEGSYDLILCNPPYIPEADREILSPEVLSEPHTALFGGEDGLYFYREITRLWKNTLRPGGHLAFEVGIKEADAVADIMRAAEFTDIGAKCDLIGIQRVVFGTAKHI